MSNTLALRVFENTSERPFSPLKAEFTKICKEFNQNVLSFGTKTTLNDFLMNFDDLFNGEMASGAIKDHWERLLEDALLYLKINDTREKAFTCIDDLDSVRSSGDYDPEFRKHHCYGMQDLTKYFESFGNFEGLLYGSSERYRDHFVHPFIVWLTGITILEKFGDKFGLQTCPNNLVVSTKRHSKESRPSCDRCDKCSDKEDQDKPCKSCMTVSRGELGAMWTIVALTHDIGYPLQKVSEITQAIGKMMDHFGRGGFDKTDFSFHSQHIQSIQTLNRIVSSKVSKEKGQAWKASIRAKYYTKSANAWLDFEHGILGSYILLRKLTFFMEADYTVDGTTNISPEDARQLAIRSEILLSIASHTNRKIYHLNPWSLSFLLVLCDEMQEWGRPSYRELRSGLDKQMFEKIEFNIHANDNEPAKITVSMSYTPDAWDEKGFKGHFDRIKSSWSERLRPGVDDANRLIKLTWTISHGEKTSSIIIDPQADIQNQIKAQ